jgi:hypothetical protein
VQATSLTTAGEVWHAFLRDYTKGWPVATFRPPKGVVQATIDAWSGGAPGPWTRSTVREWFIDGTQPGARHAIDEPGLLYTQACGSWMVNPVQAELGPARWKPDVQDWLRRALRGPGVRGALGSTTAYRIGASNWGGELLGACTTNGGGGGATGHHHHHHGQDPSPLPTALPEPSPSPTSTPRRRRVPVSSR